MKTYYEIDDIKVVQANIERDLYKEMKDFEQQIQHTNEYARGIARGLNLARSIVTCTFNTIFEE